MMIPEKKPSVTWGWIVIAVQIACVWADRLSPTDVGLPTDAQMAAFGDFNSDLHTDFFAISNDMRSVRLYLWSHSQFTFERSPLVITEPEPILNVVGGDFNYDGKLDVLVSGRNQSEPDCTVACYWMHIYYGFTDTIAGPTPSVIVTPRADDQVLVMDANNDLHPDLFGSSNGTRMFWISQADSGAVTFTTQRQIAPAGQTLHALKAPGSHAFVDLNGDCLSDLFVTSVNASGHPMFEMWLNRQSSGFVLDKVFPARIGAGAVTWSDFDADGTMDLLFPVCRSSSSSGDASGATAQTCDAENSIHIYYNQQLPMCSSTYSSSSNCRAQDNLCSEDPNYSFGPLDMTGDTASAQHVIVPTSAFVNPNTRGPLRFVTRFGIGTDFAVDRPSPSQRRRELLSKNGRVMQSIQSFAQRSANPFTAQPMSLRPSLTPRPRTRGRSQARSAIAPFTVASVATAGTAGGIAASAYLPITLRAGDADLDGSADLLIAVEDIGTQTRYLTLWHNIGCSSDTCSSDAVNNGHHTFERMSDVDSLEVVSSGAYGGAFFDINDQGALGVFALYTRSASDTNITTATSTALLNQFNEDAYFLTTLGSNGVCPAWCSSGDRFPSPKPYGVNYPGMSTKFTVTSLDGTKTPRAGAQLPQSAYLSLQTPYSLFGLGRTNNYIEQFYVGFPLNDAYYNLWVTIIPNSQLVIFPYPPDQPINWTMELFISPSSRLLWVGVSLACTCAALIGLISFFHWRERVQDEKDKTQTQHLFNF